MQEKELAAPAQSDTISGAAGTSRGDGGSQSEGASGKARDWPPHLLQAKGFRPAAPVDAKPARRRHWPILALLAVAAGGGWFSSTVWMQHGHGAVPVAARSASEKEASKLVSSDSLTFTRVLSDLRILQAAYANVQGQIANLPPRSDLDVIRSNIRNFGKALAVLKTRTAAMLKDQQAVIRTLTARLEESDQADKKMLAALTARLEKLELTTAATGTPGAAPTDATPVASIGTGKNSSKIARIAPPPPPGIAGRQPQKRNVGYVLRDVYRGAALIETPRGIMEVVPGMQLPGAGKVRSIVRRRGQWIVVTSTGIIDGY